MSKIVKIKQKDIENIVSNLLEQITQDTDVTYEDTENVDPQIQNILDKTGLEIRPGTDEKTPRGGRIGVGQDSDGNYYIVDYETDKIIAIKKQ
jgi:hypothetical protein